MKLQVDDDSELANSVKLSESERQVLANQDDDDKASSDQPAPSAKSTPSKLSATPSQDFQSNQAQGEAQESKPSTPATKPTATPPKPIVNNKSPQQVSQIKPVEIPQKAKLTTQQLTEAESEPMQQLPEKEITAQPTQSMSDDDVIQSTEAQKLAQAEKQAEEEAERIYNEQQ